MILSALFFISLVTWEFNFQTTDTLTISQAVPEQSGEYYMFNPETEQFDLIPRTPESVDSLVTLGREIRETDARLSFHIAREVLTLATELDYQKGMAGAHNLLGIKYLDFGEYELALEHYLSATRIEEELGNREDVANLFSNTGIVYLEQENYDKASEYFLASLSIWEESDRRGNSHYATNNLGVVFHRQKKYEQAMEYFRKTADLALLAEPDTLMHMIAVLNIGDTHHKLGHMDEAYSYLEQAKNYFEEHDQKILLMYTYHTLGQLHRDRQDYDLAQQYATRSLELAQQEMQRERVKDAYELLSQISEARDDYRQAYHYFQLYHQASDSLLNLQRSERISEMQIRFDVEQKDREIELLGKEAALQETRIAKQEQMRTFLLAGLILLLVIAGLLFHNNREKKKNNDLLRKRRREIEEQNLKLADLNREKDEFMSVAAHDLRNPLSVIKTSVELLRLEENPDKELLEEYTDLIQVSSSRMLNLINDLLNIQSINEGDQQVRLEELDINHSIRQSLQHFQHTAENKNITLHTDLVSSPGLILGNTGNLIRIFDNLISNAIKYSPYGSDVVISSTVQNNKIRVAIRDNGAGITQEDQEKLFGKFARLSNKPTGNESSTGLGLYIVKKLVTSMNGTVWCESETGKGTVFYVEFPITENSPSLPATENKSLGLEKQLS